MSTPAEATPSSIIPHSLMEIAVVLALPLTIMGVIPLLLQDGIPRA